MSNSRTVPPASAGGSFIIDSVKQSLRGALCALFLCLFLSACGPAAPSTSVTPQTSSSSVKTETGSAIAGISAPPGASNRPLAPGQSGTQYMPNGLPAFQPARGINADMLFAEKISDPDERFRRLENAVMDLRREFDSVSPAIVRLAAVESDMQELLGQLQTLVNNGPSDVNMDLDAAPITGVTADSLPPRPFPEAPQQEAEPVNPVPLAPVENTQQNALPKTSETQTAPAERAPPPEFNPAPTPAPAPEAAPTAPAPAPVPQSDGPVIKAMRTGEQPGGVTRIVLDLTGPSSHHSDLDNEEHLLLIEMPQARWSAAPKGTFANSPLLASWTTEPLKDGKGTRLIIQLRTAVKVTSDSSLGNPDRIVLDLKMSP